MAYPVRNLAETTHAVRVQLLDERPQERPCQVRVTVHPLVGAEERTDHPAPDRVLVVDSVASTVLYPGAWPSSGKRSGNVPLETCGRTLRYPTCGGTLRSQALPRLPGEGLARRALAVAVAEDTLAA